MRREVACPVLCPCRIQGATIRIGSSRARRRGRQRCATLEDPLVDRLVWRALKHGCGAVIARTPRAAIDCNRAEDDVDPSVVDGVQRGRVTARARGGLGIVPSRTQQHGYLWRRPITPVQLGERLDQAHRPYHHAIEEQISLLLDRFGCALLIDCHSMPPPPNGVAPIVFGDCRGRTADAWVSRDAVEIARACGFEAGSTIRSPAVTSSSVTPHRRGASMHSSWRSIAAAISTSALREPGRGLRSRRRIHRNPCNRAWRSAARPPVRDGRRVNVKRSPAPAAAPEQAPCPAASGGRTRSASRSARRGGHR